MRRRLAILCFAVAGCSFRSSPATPSDSAGSADAPRQDPDGTVAPDAELCFGRALVHVCLDVAPTTTLVLDGNFNTGSTSCTKIVSQTNGPDLCVVAGTVATVMDVVATGSRALVVIGSEQITVSGTLDVSSTSSRVGAAANFASCGAVGSGAHDRGGGGGGGGGGFGTSGGTGGTGDLNTNFDPPGTAAPGVGGTAATPAILRGGCAGGDGGAGDTTANAFGGGGAGGAGGGAVYLISPAAISIDGSVFASGAGGKANAGGNGFEQGGGGGGAGGMIGLDAPAIAVAGRVVANGGAGAGGGGNVGGAPGGDGTTMSWNQQALHGAGDSSGPGGDGADGTAIGSTTAATGSSADSGAGGGAGGVGVIWIDGVVSGGAMMSPPPAPH